MTRAAIRTDGRFALFADCLYAGALAFVASLPLVTCFAAITAACRVLDDRIERDASVTVRGYLRVFGAVVRSSAGVLLAPPAIVAVFALDVVALSAGVPGAGLATVALAVVAGYLLVVAVRAASTWRPAVPWREVIAAAAATAARRPGESLLLLLAVTAAGLIAVLSPALALVTPGLLAFAGVAIARRAEL